MKFEMHKNQSHRGTTVPWITRIPIQFLKQHEYKIK